MRAMKISACAIVLPLLSVAVLASGPVDGGWKGQIGTGDQASDIWLTLHTEDSTLTGSITSVGQESSIQDGSVDGTTLKFKTVQNDGAHTLTIDCLGSLVDNSISLTCTTEQDTPQTQEFTVTRQ
jgi:hypothetical protein